MSDQLRYLHGSDRPDCRATVDKRFVGYSALQFVYRDAVRLSCNSKHYELHAPMVWPTNPGPHVYFAPLRESWHHFHVSVTGPLLDRWRKEGLWPEHPLPVADADALAEDWRHMLSFFQDSDPWQQRRGINALEKILLDLLPVQTAAPEAEWLRAAKTKLEQGFKQSAVAKAQGMAVSTFRRRFTDIVGICPQDWLQQQRIDQARALLLHSDKPIAGIADELQYCDPAHFARQFKQRVGLSPRAYRQSRNQ